jgi:hypothetical protein
VLGNGKWRVLSGPSQTALWVNEWREKSLEGRYWRYVAHVTGGVARYEDTRRVAGERKDQTGHYQQPWLRDYRIRYYLSSYKLKAVD